MTTEHNHDVAMIRSIRDKHGGSLQDVAKLWKLLRNEEQVVMILKKNFVDIDYYVLNYKLEQALERIDRLENEIHGNKEHNPGD